MPRFLAQTSKGLVDELSAELRELGFEKLEKSPGGVYFESNWAGCYKANLQLRTASRVALTILDFPAYNDNDIYHNIQKHDFTKYIEPNGTLAVDASVSSPIFRDSRFVGQRVKDAIVDQFRDKFGERPDVDAKNPQLKIMVRVNETSVSVSLDTSGFPLFKRGYRSDTGEAPLKEHLAAGLIRMTGWKPGIPLIDPMCGSGTLLIEAGLMAKGIAPGTMRKSFGFQRWKTYQRDIFEAEAEAVIELERPWDQKIYGFDKDRRVLDAARDNVDNADLSENIILKRQSIELLEPPCEGPGIIVCNPPYGDRMGDVDLLKDLYRDLGFAMKKRFSGWQLWLLSGSSELPALMSMKAARRIPVWNGPIECRFLKYEIR